MRCTSCCVLGVEASCRRQIQLAKPSPSLSRRPADPSLLDKQRHALAKAHPGEALLSRLAKSPKGSPVTKSKAAAAVQSKKAGAKGTDKVSRAKKSNAMEVDKPKPKPKQDKAAQQQPVKAKPKTQAELDEEMKAYERQRRFAAA